MPQRRDVDDLAGVTNDIIGEARSDLEKIFARLPSDPRQARDVLLELLPALVAKHGDAAAVVAKEWYQKLHDSESDKPHEAVLGENVDYLVVEKSVRYAAGFLYEGDFDKAYRALRNDLQRLISHSTRHTVAANIRADKSHPKFARVPKGSFTCAFCLMMASRGFVYQSQETAGLIDKFHNDCDCQIVPGWGDNPKVRGYHPDRYLKMYKAAQDASEVGDLKTVLAKMREIYPDEISDGLNVVRGGHMPRDWGKGRRPIAKFGGTSRFPGEFTNPDGESLYRHELESVRTLLNHGLSIEWLAESSFPGQASPDFIMDGKAWDAKSPLGGGKNTISNQLSRGKEQAERLVIDLRRSPLEDSAAIDEIKRRLPNRRGITEIIVIKKDDSIAHFRK